MSEKKTIWKKHFQIETAWTQCKQGLYSRTDYSHFHLPYVGEKNEFSLIPPLKQAPSLLYLHLDSSLSFSIFLSFSTFNHVEEVHSYH